MKEIGREVLEKNSRQVCKNGLEKYKFKVLVQRINEEKRLYGAGTSRNRNRRTI